MRPGLPRLAKRMNNPLASVPVVILAGGLGTRLQPALPELPKGLAPIGGDPFLGLQIQLLREQGARRFVLCVGHRAEQIQAALGDGRRWNVRIDYSVERAGLLGTGGALKLAEPFFSPRALVLNGDTYFALDYARFLRRHLRELEREPPVATIAVARAGDARSCGRTRLDPAGSSVVAFEEKRAGAPEMGGWLNGGAYVIEREVLELLAANRVYSLEREVFPRLLRLGMRVAVVRSSRPFYDIGTPQRLDRFRRLRSARGRERARKAASSP